ncbi:hypothetical protein DYB32_005236 [Aphanomyces invadans]|uniref:Uncharacterized protein n=1 Tax=Aphanomyces invadans TaxID=157072 RepID=A0A418AV48_9STRA|nr:hypothetical protein DYB32_005236 [Aphanomyces invadans]
MNSPIARAAATGKPMKRQAPSTTSMSPTKRARLVGNLTISVSANLLARTDEYRGRCKYKSGRCPNERTIKFSGEPHTLCEEHRVKHNKNQRKSDAKRRGVVKIKRDGSTSCDDDDDGCPVYMKKDFYTALPMGCNAYASKAPAARATWRCGWLPRHFPEFY